MGNRIISFLQDHQIAIMSVMLLGAIVLSTTGEHTADPFTFTPHKTGALILLVGAMGMALLPFKPLPKKPQYKVNEPCPCGSGKKFKKCCMPR